MQLHGIHYEFTRGSSVTNRDGMFLEASIQESNPLIKVAEVFYSDENGRYVINCFQPDVPIELIEHLISEAKLCLPPSAPPA